MIINRDYAAGGRSAAIGDRGMVATSHPVASEAALEILRSGGNAVDGALTAAALLAVIEPAMTGIGGDCFALISHRGAMPTAINGSGATPSALDPHWFSAQGLTGIPPRSVHAVTIPGAVDAWCCLHERYGSLPLDRLFTPAIAAARSGFLVTPRVALDWADSAPLLRDAHTAGRCFLPGGRAPIAGDRFYHPALAGTLERIAAEGRAGFYQGIVADHLVRHLTAAGGRHDLGDFADHGSRWVTPIAAPYRDHQVYECPPNGQGLAALLILRILDGFDLGPDCSPALRTHLMAEATKAAYRQRDLLFCDPDHRDVPVTALLGDRVIERLREEIRTDHAGLPSLWDLPLHADTTYLSVVDRDLTSVSFINSIFSSFGSLVYEPETGVLLHNRGAGFQLDPHHPNALAPGKRPMHTIIPGMLVKDDKVVMPFGVMGGHYQACGHSQLISNILDLGMDVQEAIDAPRSFAYDGIVQLERRNGVPLADDLANRGHRIEWLDRPLGGGQGIYLDHQRGVMIGGSDSRKDGCALAL